MWRSGSRRWAPLALALVACSRAAPSPPASPPSIAGRVTAVDRTGERIGRIRVETQPSDSFGSPKAVVRITQDTEVLHGAAARVGIDALATGQWVRVWFTGPVAESYPVQATAAVVAIDTAGP